MLKPRQKALHGRFRVHADDAVKRPAKPDVAHVGGAANYLQIIGANVRVSAGYCPDSPAKQPKKRVFLARGLGVKVYEDIFALALI